MIFIVKYKEECEKISKDILYPISDSYLETRNLYNTVFVGKKNYKRSGWGECYVNLEGYYIIGFFLTKTNLTIFEKL